VLDNRGDEERPLRHQPLHRFLPCQGEIRAAALPGYKGISRLSCSSLSRCGSDAVGVFDAQPKCAAVMPREEPVEERRTGAADMKKPGRGGCETDDDAHFSLTDASGSRCI